MRISVAYEALEYPHFYIHMSKLSYFEIFTVAL